MASQQIVVPSQLNCFGPGLQQDSIVGSKYQVLYPVNVLTRPLSFIEFHSPGVADLLRDLSYMYLGLKVCARDAEEKLDVSCSLVNNMLHSLFIRLEIHANERCIVQIDNYGYYALLYTLFNNSPEAATAQLTTQGFYFDDPKNHEVAGADNTGWAKRKALLAGGKTVELFGPLYSGLTNLRQLVPSGVDLRVRLTLQNEDFYMWSEEGNTDKLHILEAALYIKQILLNPGVLLAHAKILAENNAVYPLKNVDMRTFTVPSGGRSITLNSICMGKLPSFFACVMVNNKHFNGVLTQNPYSFVHKSLTSATLFVNADRIEFPPVDFHTKNICFQRCYHELFSSFGLDRRGTSNLITPDMFQHGTFILVKDLTPDSSGHVSHTAIPAAGTLRLELQFAKELDTALTILCLLEFDAVMEVTNARNVFIS